LPLVHVSFKYRPNRRPVPARGVIAIVQFAVGVVCIAQFSIGLLTISQFTIAAFALAQFAAAYSLVAQVGVYVAEGHGQLVLQLLTVVPGDLTGACVSVGCQCRSTMLPSSRRS
jgi:hypothetical protein